MIKNTRKLNLYLTTGQGTKAERRIAQREGFEDKTGRLTSLGKAFRELPVEKKHHA